MISRYARKEMTQIWSAATKYRIWFEIEAHVWMTGLMELVFAIGLLWPKYQQKTGLWLSLYTGQSALRLKQLLALSNR